METAGADVAGAAAVEEAAGVAGEDELAAKERYAVIVEKNTATETSTAQDTSVLLLDAEPTFHALLDDLAAGVPASVISRRFHDAMVGAIVMSAELVRAMYDISTVALSGGVFMNRYLVEHALADLAAAGFTVAINRDLPPNDGCISLGQARGGFRSFGRVGRLSKPRRLPWANLRQWSIERRIEGAAYVLGNSGEGGGPGRGELGHR